MDRSSHDPVVLPVLHDYHHRANVDLFVVVNNRQCWNELRTLVMKAGRVSAPVAFVPANGAEQPAVNPDSFASPITLKIGDVVQIGNRTFYLRKITNKDYVFRALRRDQIDKFRARHS